VGQGEPTEQPACAHAGAAKANETVCCEAKTPATTQPVPMPACGSSSRDEAIHRVSLDVPEIVSQEVAGEWLIPKDGVLLISFGPYTVADSEGKAVIRERLAIIEAAEAAGARIQGTGRAVSSMTLPRLEATVPPPIQPPVPIGKVPMPVPTLPSRSIPQGLRPDGTAAELPPLPDDEVDEPASGSSEPMASPQTKKPARPRPAADNRADKAVYSALRSLSIPSRFLPNSSIGLQFLMRGQPLTLKLPFNQKLVIEVYGKVVPDDKPRDESAR
jgi:hypothetical protein